MFENNGSRLSISSDSYCAGSKKISGPSVTTNAGHEFCWTTCHNQIADPNSAPKENECAKCHRVENIRAGQ